MIIFLLSYNNIRIITNICIICLRRSISTSEEPHAPQIKRDDELQQDVGGAYAGPFNEGEELRLVCQVHGGDITPASSHWPHYVTLLPRAAAPLGVLVC